MTIQIEQATSGQAVEQVDLSLATCGDLEVRTKADLRQCIRRYANNMRAELARDPLREWMPLNYGAQQHTRLMANETKLFHSTNLAEDLEVAGIAWSWASETIGVGTEFEELMLAFRNSPQHYADIMKQRATHIGIGVIYEIGYLWITMWIVDTRR